MAAADSEKPLLKPDYESSYDPPSQQVLSSAGRTVMVAIVRGIMPRTRDGEFVPAIEQEVVNYIENFLRYMQPLLQRGFGLLLHILNVLPILRHRRKLTQLSDDQVLALCEGWRDSRILPLREAMKAIRAISMSGIYGHPVLWDRIGYKPQGFVQEVVARRKELREA